MNKPFVQKILAVVLGISLFVMLMSFVSLIFDAALIDDVSTFANEDLMNLSKWMTVGIICILIPTFVCYAFTFFAKSKIFSICSAVLSAFVTICSIAFIFVLRAEILDNFNLQNYSLLTGYVQEMLILAVPALLVCVYFILNSINLFRHKNSENNAEATTNEEN